MACRARRATSRFCWPCLGLSVLPARGGTDVALPGASRRPPRAPHRGAGKPRGRFRADPAYTRRSPWGSAFQRKRLRVGQRALWGLGLFSTVEVKSEPDGDGQRPRSSRSRRTRGSPPSSSQGTRRSATEDLKGKVTCEPGSSCRPQEARGERRAVETAYRDEGTPAPAAYPRLTTPQTGSRPHHLPRRGRAAGQDRAVEFAGNSAFAEEQLRKAS